MLAHVLRITRRGCVLPIRVVIPMHYAIDGLTHPAAIEPPGTFGPPAKPLCFLRTHCAVSMKLTCRSLLGAGGMGLGKLDGWLDRVAARGGVVRRVPGEISRRRDCHLMAPPVPVLHVVVSIGMNRGCQ